MRDGFVVLTQLHICVTNIFGYFEPHFLGCVGEDIKCHLVHLDCSRILLLVVVDVTHIDPDSSSKGVLLALYNFVVFSEGFLEHSTCLQAEGVVESHSE